MYVPYEEIPLESLDSLNGNHVYDKLVVKFIAHHKMEQVGKDEYVGDYPYTLQQYYECPLGLCILVRWTGHSEAYLEAITVAPMKYEETEVCINGS